MIFHKQTSFHKTIWTSQVLFDLKTAQQDMMLFSGELGEFKISSFIVDDINNDDTYDLIISVDIQTEDGFEKTVIVRAFQNQKQQF